MITTAYVFQLPQYDEVTATAGDDAGAVGWHALDALDAADFFEDHYRIIKEIIFRVSSPRGEAQNKSLEPRNSARFQALWAAAGFQRGEIVKDIKLYIEKLHGDAEDCMAISRTAPREAKRKIFTALADTYLRLAGELEKIAAANAILDEERDKNLLGLLGGEGNAAHSLAQIANVLNSDEENDVAK